MKGRKPTAASLARVLRIGLLGSPYDWGHLDFEDFKQNHAALNLTSFPGTSEANRQDLLICLSDGNHSVAGNISHDNFSVLEWSIPRALSTGLTPEIFHQVFQQATDKLNDHILSNLKEHQHNYVNTESIIAKYGTQVIHAGSLLKKSQIHIENDALAYLIATPWRNENELNYMISRMVFYAEGDVLHKPYVQNSVYEFGTSARGISNSGRVRTLVESFTRDLISEFDFRTASLLFKIQLPSFAVELDDQGSLPERKRAA